MATRTDFIKVDDINYHVYRRKEILKKYPRVKELTGPYQLSALYIVLIVSFQFVMAYFLKDYSIIPILICAYLIGAFASHALYVMIHECTHNLVFKSSLANKLMGLVCDFPLVLPSAMGFRKYHMIHHKHLGEYSYDPDITSYTESKLVGNSAIRKTIWLALFSLSQAFRPLKVQFYKPLNVWTVSNVAINILICIVIYSLFTPMALAYLILSTIFALGLHPLGGRWIQEHYITKEGQETYSYYGPLNKLTFNMGYHNEHHDLMNIPWINLPKLKELAPEYYNNLKSYQSWTRVILNFIFNKEMNSFKRIIHPDKHPKGFDQESSLYEVVLPK